MVAEEAAVILAELVTGLVEALVDRMDEVDVHLAWQDDCALLSVTVSPDDLGKMIGRNGQTARALRTIVRGASNKLKVRSELNIMAVKAEAEVVQ